jgi:hypothetical protein
MKIEKEMVFASTIKKFFDFIFHSYNRRVGRTHHKKGCAYLINSYRGKHATRVACVGCITFDAIIMNKAGNLYTAEAFIHSLRQKAYAYGKENKAHRQQPPT